MYLLLNKRFTTAKLEAASCGDLMKIFSENDETQKHPMIYCGPPVICFICQRMMAQMTPAQRREIGLPEAPPSVNMSESTIQFNETTEGLARQCAFSEVGENARLEDTAQMQKLWNSSGIRREYKIGSPIHAYRQYGPKQDSIVWFVAQNTIQWNWVECFEGYSDDVPSHTAYQQDGYQDWFDNPQPSVRPSGCEAQMGILHFTFVKKTYFLHEGAKINRQLMKKGPSTYFHSHLVDGHDVTNKISRQYGYPANHCDVGSSTAIIHGRFYPGVTEWPLEMSPIQHATRYNFIHSSPGINAIGWDNQLSGQQGYGNVIYFMQNGFGLNHGSFNTMRGNLIVANAPKGGITSFQTDAAISTACRGFSDVYNCSLAQWTPWAEELKQVRINDPASPWGSRFGWYLQDICDEIATTDGKNQRITGIDASGNAVVYIDQAYSNTGCIDEPTQNNTYGPELHLLRNTTIDPGFAN